MSAYKLSPEAARAEAQWSKSRTEQKEIIGSGQFGAWAGGASRQDGTNFRTNQVTLAEFSDRLVSANPLGLSATWSCVNLIAGTIGSLPLMVYRNDASGVRSIARDHPLYYVLHDSPNFDQTALDFWEILSAGLELQGNAYAAVERRRDGSVYSLTPVRPDLVKVERRNGRLAYEWAEDGRTIRKDVEEVLHIRGPMGNAMGGVSTMSACRGAFSGAISADNAASTVFANGMRPSGVLSTDPSVSLTREQRIELNGYMQENFQGSINQGRPMLLDRGMKWQQINITPEDAQMLESRKFSGEEICRIFGVPPAMVGYGDKASNWGTGKEVDVLGFIKFTLRRRLKRIEQALQKQLLTPADKSQGVTIEFNIEALLRGDSESRANFYQSGLSNGWRTINEVRALENLPPIDGGDVPRMQMQNVPITEAGGDVAGVKP